MNGSRRVKFKNDHPANALVLLGNPSQIASCNGLKSRVFTLRLTGLRYVSRFTLIPRRRRVRMHRELLNQ